MAIAIWQPCLRPLVVVCPVSLAQVDVLERSSRLAVLVSLPAAGSPSGDIDMVKKVAPGQRELAHASKASQGAAGSRNLRHNFFTILVNAFID